MRRTSAAALILGHNKLVAGYRAMSDWMCTLEMPLDHLPRRKRLRSLQKRKVVLRLQALLRSSLSTQEHEAADNKDAAH